MASHGTSCVKCIFFIVNLAVWIASVGLMVIGVWMLVESTYFWELFAEESIMPMAIMAILLGVVGFLIGFSGCCGACKESICLLVVNFLLMLLLISGEIALGVLVLNNRADVEESMTIGMTVTIKEHYGETKAATESVDFAQQTFHCCGATNVSDYDGSVFQTKSIHGDALPDSCCGEDTESTGSCSYTSPSLKPAGCVKSISDSIKGNDLTAVLVGLAAIIVQMIAVVLSCCLTSQISSSGGYSVV